MLSIRSAKLTGVPGVSGWSQVHEFTPEDPEKIRQRGHLFAVVSTKRVEETSVPEGLRPGGGVDTVATGRELLGRLHEEYFGDLTVKPFYALKNAIEKVIAEFSSSWGDVEIAATSFVKDVVYSAAGGGAQVVICRGGSLATILSSSGPSVVSASGFPQEGDRLLLGTKSFFARVPQGVIKASLQSADPESAVETFAPAIHEQEDSGDMGAVVIKFEEKSVFSQNIIPSVSSNKTFAIKTETRNLLSNFINKISKFLPERRIYIKTSRLPEAPESQSKRMTFSVGLILLVVLGVSIGFGIRQKNIKEVRSKYEAKLSQAEHELDEATGLAGVSPVRARELFVSSEQKLAEIDSLGVKDERIDGLRKKIEEQKGVILGEYEGGVDLFLDLSLLSSGFRGDAISSSGNVIFILDKGSKKIVSVEFENKKSKVAAGPDKVDGALNLTSYEDRVFILKEDGIYEVSKDEKQVVDKTWEGDVLIYAYAGNLYVLDKNQGAVYRFAGDGEVFGSKQNWLAAGTKPNFSTASVWTIDGTVYVLIPPAKILKFSLGSPQAFPISGVFPDINSVDAIYSNEDNQFLYLLDKADKRVIVLDKKGEYKAQYVSDKITEAESLVVSEKEKKIILLTGDKLYSIDIEHL